MIRILHVLGGTNLGGAESRTMDLFRHMDPKQVSFDFLVHSAGAGFYDEEIRQLGGQIYHVPRFKVYNYFAYKKAVKLFFAEHHMYRAVQGHMTSTASIYLPIAKKQGVTMTIAHARSAGVDQGVKGILTKWLRHNLAKKADFLFACSRIAGEAAFGKKAAEEGRIIVIPNAITTEKFVYTQKTREQIRGELSVQDKFVIGHVGRFHYAKNHEYLLQIFEELRRLEPQAVLLLLGEGEGMPAMQELAKKLQIEDAVIFAGNQKNVQDYYQAMDYFVFPSRFEGLPGTVIEAQAAGLRCLISDTIAEEVRISELVQTMSIQDAPESWAAFVAAHRNYERMDQSDRIRTSGFDSTLQAEKMMNFYETGDGNSL